jgi:Flp pilus assembly protein TadG
MSIFNQAPEHRHLLRRIVFAVGRDIDGVAATEFAFIAPVLMVMLLCTIDLGTGIYRKMQVQNAAQAGAEYAIVHGFSSSISNAVTSATSFSSIAATPAPSEFCGCPSSTTVTSASCSSTCSDGTMAGTYVTVSAQGTYSTIFSYPTLPSSFQFSAQSTVRIQ